MTDGDEGSEVDPAAAFEALRHEVTALRRAVEHGTAPDYTVTLGQIVGSLQQIERHPAFKLTPEEFDEQVTKARDVAEEKGKRDLAAAADKVRVAGEQLSSLVLHHREAKDQHAAVWSAGWVGSIVGGVVGVAFWIMIGGWAVRALPSDWALPERLSLATMGEKDGWIGGSRLMRLAHPQDWDEVLWARQLQMDNAVALRECRRAAAKAHRAQACKVTVIDRE